MRNVLVAAAAALAAGCFGGLKNEVPAPLIYRVDAPDVGPAPALPRRPHGRGRAHGAGPRRRRGSRAAGRAGASTTSPAPAGPTTSAAHAAVRAGRIASRNPAGCVPCRATLGRFRGDAHAGRSRCAASRPTTRRVACRSRRWRWPRRSGATPTGSVLASFTAAAREDAAENRQTSVVAALDAAFARAASELATRSFETSS